VSNVHKSFAVLIFGLLIGHVGWIKFSFPAFTYLIDYVERLAIIGLYLYFFDNIDLRPSERVTHNIAAIFAGLLIVFIHLFLRALALKYGIPTAGDRFPPLYGWVFGFDLTVGLILAVIAEELVYRKLMMDVIETYTKKPLAIYLTSAVIFALLHVNQGTVTTALAFFAGLILMFLYRWSGRLSVAMIAHYFADLIIFGVLH
jgi:membrane protease YdiL (CAAX protease family)